MINFPLFLTNISSLEWVLAFCIFSFSFVAFFSLLKNGTKSLFKPLSYGRLTSVLPFSKVGRDGWITFQNGDKGILYDIDGVSRMFLSDKDKDNFFDVRQHFIKSIHKKNVEILLYTQHNIQEKSAIKNNSHSSKVVSMIRNRWQKQNTKTFSIKHYMCLVVKEKDSDDKISRQVESLVESILTPFNVKKSLNPLKFFQSLISPMGGGEIGLTQYEDSLRESMHTHEINFIKDGSISWEYGGRKLFSKIISIKSSPDFLDELMVDDIVALPFQTSFIRRMQPISKEKSDLLILKYKKFSQTNKLSEVVERQYNEVEGILDKDSSNAEILLDFYEAIQIFADSVEELDKAILEVQKIFQKYQTTPIVEKRGATASWFGFLPTFDVLMRPYKIFSQAATCHFVFNKIPEGAEKSDWIDEPIVVFPTAVGTPYKYQFHISSDESAVAHTVAIGPTGQGKTTLYTFLASQAMRIPDLKIFFFDRFKGAQTFTLATGGDYLEIENIKRNDKVGAVHKSVAFNPMDIEDSQANRMFLKQWLAMLAGTNNSVDLGEISRAVSVNFDYLSPDDRSLKNLYESCFNINGNVKKQLAKWVDDQQYGNIFNAPKDTLSLDNNLISFDMTNFLNDDTLAPPLLSYMLFRIQRETIQQGSPSLVIIDETAPMLENENFREFFVTGLREGRKNRQAYLASFQQANLIDKIGMGDIIRGQAQTIIFFRNPAGTEEDYKGWKLNKREMLFIKGQLFPNIKYAVLISRPITNESVILNVDLSALGDYIQLFNSGKKYVKLAQEIFNKGGHNFFDEYIRRSNS
ncbi:MAG: hypothetical protein JJV96_02535 [Alphaproteobacteria bacterium]|nr:hypothetical protein [Alphaproteobacteria bacterium]